MYGLLEAALFKLAVVLRQDDWVCESLSSALSRGERRVRIQNFNSSPFRATVSYLRGGELKVGILLTKGASLLGQNPF